MSTTFKFLSKCAMLGSILAASLMATPASAERADDYYYGPGYYDHSHKHHRKHKHGHKYGHKHKHHKKYGKKYHKHKRDRRDYAEVVSVRPIYRTVRVSTPERECWEEPVQHRRHYSSGHDSYTPLIIGGILGGVVGNQFGGGSGKGILTAAGAILGGSLAHDVQSSHRRHHRHGHSEVYTTYERRCQTHVNYHEEERVDGYRVKYRYNGKIYRTRTDYHPGEYIEVDVNVRPVH